MQRAPELELEEEEKRRRKRRGETDGDGGDTVSDGTAQQYSQAERSESDMYT